MPATVASHVHAWDGDVDRGKAPPISGLSVAAATGGAGALGMGGFAGAWSAWVGLATNADPDPDAGSKLRFATATDVASDSLPIGGPI